MCRHLLILKFDLFTEDNEKEDKGSSESEYEDEYLSQTISDLEKAIDAFNDKKPEPEEETISRSKSLKKKKSTRKARSVLYSM